MPSASYNVFNIHVTKKINALADLFDEINANRGPNRNYALLHGGLMVLVSGWETYCEDVCAESIGKIINRNSVNFDSLPNSARRRILEFAWPARIDNINILESKLARLPDGGWRQTYKDLIDSYLRDFNSPKFYRQNGKNLRKLFAMFLEADLIRELPEITNVEDLPALIDEIVTIRGAIAHRGEPENNFTSAALRHYLLQFHLACAAIDTVIHTEFRNRYGFAPWQITRRITDVLPQ